MEARIQVHGGQDPGGGLEYRWRPVSRQRSRFSWRLGSRWMPEFKSTMASLSGMVLVHCFAAANRQYMSGNRASLAGDRQSMAGIRHYLAVGRESIAGRGESQDGGRESIAGGLGP